MPAARPCKGACNVEIANYRGGKSPFGSSQAKCTISKLSRHDKVLTIHDKCVDICGGAEIAGGPTLVAVASPARFTMADKPYRDCGTKVQF